MIKRLTRLLEANEEVGVWFIINKAKFHLFSFCWTVEIMIWIQVRYI